MLLPDDADPLLGRFSTFWLKARKQALAPRYKDLDPVQMPWALPSIFVLEREGDAPFVYRLVGETMQVRLSPVMRGKTAYDIFEYSYADWTENRWKRAANELLASFVYTRHETSGGRHISSQRILFPALDQDGYARYLVGVSAFDNNVFQPGLGIENIEHRNVRWTKLSELPVNSPIRDTASL
jgi:hypothetical protein